MKEFLATHTARWLRANERIWIARLHATARKAKAHSDTIPAYDPLRRLEPVVVALASYATARVLHAVTQAALDAEGDLLEAVTNALLHTRERLRLRAIVEVYSWFAVRGVLPGELDQGLRNALEQVIAELGRLENRIAKEQA